MEDAHDLISRMHQASYHENQPVSAEKQEKPFPQYLDNVSNESGLIFLPDCSGFIPQHNDLLDVLIKRRSLRRYDESVEMSLVELSYLLKYTQGVREIDEKRSLTIRFVPSAGSRHPFETFVLVQRVAGLTQGLYRYIAQRHALEVFDLAFEAIQKAHESVYKQKQVITSAVTFFWAANVYRTSWRYSTRAYRYMNLDAGHVCQNLYLCAESIDYGVCAIAAFDDHLTNQLFNLDEVKRFMVYAASVGKKIPQA
jgi:SagB-type dehydrogenase family enzyme